MMDPFKLFQRISEISAAAGAKDYVKVAKLSIELGLDAVPVDELKGYLDAGAAERDRMIADQAETAKFGG